MQHSTRLALIAACAGLPCAAAFAQSNNTLRIVGNPHPWVGLIDGDDYFDGFESYTMHSALSPSASWFELAGQVAPSGYTWLSAANYNGVVNNAIAQSGSNWNPTGTGFDRHGVTGGPDPTGERSQFFASPRGTIDPQAIIDGGSILFAARTGHYQYMPLVDEPTIQMIDLYLDDITTLVWVRPYSTIISGSIFLGGYDFQYFTPFVNSDSVVDRIVTLGPEPGQQNTGVWFGASDPHRIQEREWITVAIRSGIGSYSVWVRDSTTVGVNGFEQDSMYDGFPGDPTRGAFAGEPFADGWLQVFPGVDDDPGTTVVEGYGAAYNRLDQAPTAHLDTTGSPAGRELFVPGAAGMQLAGGGDPDASDIPDFQPHDWYADNYTVMGTPYYYEQLAPYELPFLDDFEDQPLGPAVWLAPSGEAQAIDDDQNHTPGGSKAFRDQITYADGLFTERGARPVPPTLAGDGDPTSVSMWLRQSGPRASKGLFATPSSSNGSPATGTAFRLILGAEDGAGVVDDRVYARLPNPNFDPSQPESIVPLANEQHIPGANARFVNVPLVDSGGSPLTTPLDQWYELSVEIGSPAGAPGSLRVFIDGAEGFADGSVEGMSSLASRSRSFGEIEIWGGATAANVGGTFWLDDLSIGGPAFPIPTPLTIGDPEFTAHPPYGSPYSDDFESYDDQRSLEGQGATPRFGFAIPHPDNYFDVIPLDAGQTVDTTTLGYYYTIDEVIEGAAPVAPGSQIFVVDNLPPSTPDAFAPDYRRGVFRTTSGEITGEAAWTLQSSTPSTWDGSTTVAGRFLFRYEARWSTAADAARTGPDPTGTRAGGQVAIIESSFVSNNATTGDLDEVLTGLLSDEAPAPTGVTRLAFDLYVPIDDLAVGPRSRLAWRLERPDDGAGFPLIAQIVFGGPNNLIDENTFDPNTGAVTPGADGEPDDYFGSESQADPRYLYVLRDNPMAGFGNPDFILEQTAWMIPGDTWLRCEAEVQENGDWTITLDDGVSPFVLTGSALEAIDGTLGSLDLWSGFDPGGNGEPAPQPITFTALGAAAAPEGGLAPLSTSENPSGSYNTVADPEYSYFTIFEIDPGATGLPDVTEVDVATGAIMGTRSMSLGDTIVLWNDRSTAGTAGPAGTPFLDQIATNERFRLTNDGGATISARGTWIPLGLPNQLGNLAPSGGVANGAPPYNPAAPYETILMGSIVEFPALGAAPPVQRWYIDDVALEVVGCDGDLNLDGTVDGADLGLLLGDWGAGGGAADLNGDGVVDGADLGLLLGAWGACP